MENDSRRAVTASWQSEVHDPSTGHPLMIDVLERIDGSSLVKVIDPTQGDANDPTGQDRARTGVIEGRPLSERTGQEARQFFAGVRAIAKGESVQGVKITPSSEL